MKLNTNNYTMKLKLIGEFRKQTLLYIQIFITHNNNILSAENDFRSMIHYTNDNTLKTLHELS